MSRNILRARIAATTPGTRTYATWNPSDKSANITLSGSNLVASSVAATGQSVRSTAAFTTGRSYYCELKWNSGTGVYFGVGNSSASLSQAPGANANSWALANTGNKWNNGANSAYTTSISTGGTIGLLMRWDKASDTWAIHFRTTSGVISSTAAYTGLTGTLYLMVGATTAFNATLNAGASASVYAVPDGALPGLWTTAADTSTPLYIASEGHITNNVDAVPNTLFSGRLLPTSRLEIDRSVSVWPWQRNGAARSGYGQLIVDNRDSALDSWGDLNIRGKEVVLEFATPDEIYGTTAPTYTTWCKCIVDSLTYGKDGTIAVTLGDRNLLLDKPSTSKVFPSWVAEAVRERSQYVALGTAYFDPALVDATSYIFDACDDVVWACDELRDRGDLDTVNTDYTVRNNGVDKVHIPVGRVSGKFRCGVKRGTQLFTDAFTSWSAGAFDNNPSSWTVSGESSANERVYERTTGRCALKKSGGGSALYMERNVGFVAGTTYVVTVPVTFYSTGEVRFYTSNGAGVTSSELFRVDGTKRVGTHSFLVTPTAGQTYLRFQIPASYTAEAEFESVTINAATHIQRLPDWIYELIVTRGALSGSEYDSASVTALDTLAPYTLGYFAAGAAPLRAILQDTLDSFCGWISRDLDGVLRVGRLQEPALTPDLTLYKQDTLDDLVREPDRAPNLSVTIGALRNWNPHLQTDFATSVTASDRARLSADFQIVRSMTGLVDPFYSHADNAPAKGTLLVTAADAAAESERMAALYAKRRHFYVITALLDVITALGLRPGDTVKLVMPYFDLATGKNLLVVGITQTFFKREVILTLWG